MQCHVISNYTLLHRYCLELPDLSSNFDVDSRRWLLSANIDRVMGFFWSMCSDEELAEWTEDFFSFGRDQLKTNK